MAAELRDVALPDFGLPAVELLVPQEEYIARIDAARGLMQAAKLEVLIVYGDREHFGNLAYITGYDPRFEESLCVLPRTGKRMLLVGNEGLGYAALCPLELNVKLYQSFSLPGQPRVRLVPLKRLLRKSGGESGMRVGVGGWKYFERSELRSPKRTSEIPAWVLEAVRAAAGNVGNVRNTGPPFIHPAGGLRERNSVHQLARFEYAATLASQMVHDADFGLQPGQTQFDAVRNIRWCGWPLACHLMLSGGERARVGLASPSSRPLQLGDPITTVVGLLGALTARAGFLVHEAGEFPADIADYVDKLAAQYFRAALAWYEKLAIGCTGGELFAAVHEIVGAAFFGVGLNPGHLIHLDEWMHSPFTANSSIELASGMAPQCDVIPATGSRYFTSNIEDGVALADDVLRADFSARYPEAWGHITARRDFMQSRLSIHLRPAVLPFSNLCGNLPPFLLVPQRAFYVA